MPPSIRLFRPSPGEGIEPTATASGYTRKLPWGCPAKGRSQIYDTYWQRRGESRPTSSRHIRDEKSSSMSWLYMDVALDELGEHLRRLHNYMEETDARTRNTNRQMRRLMMITPTTDYDTALAATLKDKKVEWRAKSAAIRKIDGQTLIET